jgi:hypothetical protein
VSSCERVHDARLRDGLVEDWFNRLRKPLQAIAPGDEMSSTPRFFSSVMTSCQSFASSVDSSHRPRISLRPSTPTPSARYSDLFCTAPGHVPRSRGVEMTKGQTRSSGRLCQPAISSTTTSVSSRRGSCDLRAVALAEMRPDIPRTWISGALMPRAYIARISSSASFPLEQEEATSDQMVITYT